MNVILMLILISILVIVHELGHFLAARFFNIKVDKFGFGLPIGPVLYKTKWGDTEVLVHALLLGGYVSFPDDDENSDIPLDSDERFNNKPIYQRAIVISAGVIANVLCAFVLVFLTASLWGKLPSGTYDTYVSKVLSLKNNSSVSLNLKQGDKILKINGKKVQFPYEINMYSQLSKKFDGLVDKNIVDKNFLSLKKLNPNLDPDTYIDKGIKIKLLPLVLENKVYLNDSIRRGIGSYKVETEYPLDDNIKILRDKIFDKTEYISDGKVTLYDIAKAQSDTFKPIYLTVLRNNEIIDLDPIYSDKDGVLGIEKKIVENYYQTRNIKDIAKYSSKYLFDNTALMIWGLGKIFTGAVPLKDLHGIVAITKIGSDIIEHQGIFKGILLTAVISLNLAIVNILPIPALDGGHLLFLLIEKIKGSPINEKVLGIIANTFFLLLILFMFFIIFNDIFALATNKF